MLRHQLDKPSVVGENIDRPRLDLMKDSLVKIFDRESHVWMLANMRTIAWQIYATKRLNLQA